MSKEFPSVLLVKGKYDLYKQTTAQMYAADFIYDMHGACYKARYDRDDTLNISQYVAPTNF